MPPEEKRTGRLGHGKSHCSDSHISLSLSECAVALRLTCEQNIPEIPVNIFVSATLNGGFHLTLFLFLDY
jgi:hypothetical protein